MRGECLNLLMTISGNRYGRGLIRPGGVLFDIPPAMAGEVHDRIARLEEDWLWSHAQMEAALQRAIGS